MDWPRYPISLSLVILIGSLVSSGFCDELNADMDWPMWRYDAGRTAVTPHGLSGELHLQWTLRRPPLQPAFRNERLHFDAGYEPIVMGDTLLVGS